KRMGKPAARSRAAAIDRTSHKTTNGRSTARASRPVAQVTRRDRAGHFDPRYEAELRAKSLEGRGGDDAKPFVRGSRSGDDLAEELGEETIATMTTGEDEHKESLEQAVDE